jgi:phage protein D
LSSIPLLDDTTFAVGNSIEIRLGYAGDLEPVFAGEITALEPQFNAGQLPNLTVRGYDRRHRLQRGCNTRTFLKQKDSAIAAQIAQEAGLTSEVTDTEVIHDYVLQADQTDLAFLQARARQIQYEVIVEGKKLLFRPVGNAASAILTLTLEDDLLEFAPRLSAAGQVSHTSVRGWNFKEKKEIVGKATAGNEVSTMGGQRSGARLSQTAFGKATEQVSDRPVATKAEADQRAVALLNRDVLMLVTGEGICQGRTDLRAGKVIKIDRIGKRFSGEYYVTSASHRYSSGGYYTHFTVRRNAV